MQNFNSTDYKIQNRYNHGPKKIRNKPISNKRQHISINMNK